MERLLDWAPHHDPESRNYPIRTVLPQVVTIRKRFWRRGPILDQGREGACVGFGWMAELMAAPMGVNVKVALAVLTAYAQRIYRAAQHVDEWSGTDYEGTSVLAGAKVVKSLGHIGGYRWVFSPRDLRDTLIEHGPVVIGIWWYTGMFYPDATGLIRPTGKKEGGHCVAVTGYHPRMRLGRQHGWFKRYEVYEIQQSWGRKHGKRGRVFILAEDLHALLADQGEACVPIDRKPVRLI